MIRDLTVSAIGSNKCGLQSCTLILLRSHWVLVVTDVFTRRISGFGVERATSTA